MNCPRCHGVMVCEEYSANSLEGNPEAFRCVSCGEILDQVIIENRKQGLVEVPLSKGCYLLLTAREFREGIRRGKARQRFQEHAAQIEAKERSEELKRANRS